MAGVVSKFFDRVLHKRVLRRWAQAGDVANSTDLESLRGMRARARALRRNLDRVIHEAEHRLALPVIGSNIIRKPMGTDWAWRPNLWKGAIPVPGFSSVPNKAEVYPGATIFHDCRRSELTVRQIRNTREADIAPFGFRMDVFRFDGSFLSLVLDLPEEAARGLRQRHLLRMDVIVEMEKPLEIFARLNIKHGPNVEQIVRELPMMGEEVGIVSYAMDRSEAPSLQEVCEIMAQRSDLMVLTCAVEFGASGAPVFAMRDGEVRIVSVVSAKAELAFAEHELKRYNHLAGVGAGTVQNAQQARTRIDQAAARLANATAVLAAERKQVEILSAQRDAAEGGLKRAHAALEMASYELSYTRIVAPVDGMVGERAVRVGAYVTPGSKILAVVPLAEAYVVANFQETQLTAMHAGQAVEVRVDSLGGETLHGRVESLAPATGVTFAAVKPDNATGNFTKVVQRIPVKIVLDDGQPLLTRLRVGMSVEATIDTRGDKLDGKEVSAR